MVVVNSTVELMTLWASSSPSLMAFCFSHVIIAVLLLGSRGCAPDVNGRADELVTEGPEAETPDAAAAAQLQEIKCDSGGHGDPVTAMETPEAHCGGEECSVGAGEADAPVLRTEAREESGGQGEVSIAVDASSSEEEDELMTRAEEFIQRMNRAWRTESVHVG